MKTYFWSPPLLKSNRLILFYDKYSSAGMLKLRVERSRMWNADPGRKQTLVLAFHSRWSELKIRTWKKLQEEKKKKKKDRGNYKDHVISFYCLQRKH